MSQIKLEYQRQIDDFCNDNNRITAQDILNRAQDSSAKEEKVAKFSAKGKRSMVWRAAIPAVLCFLLVGTTTLAATGHLADFFRNIFGDEKTAEIVEQGYVYEINRVLTDGEFMVNLLGITGDSEHPIIAMDVYVNDKSLVEGRDRIYVQAYCVGSGQFDTELESYTTFDAFGEKDEEIENLYHVSLEGSPYWISSGEEIIIAIRSIRIGNGDRVYGGDEWGDEWDSYYPDMSKMQYRFTFPTEQLHPVEHMEYDDIIFEQDGIQYYMYWVTYGEYNAEMVFRYHQIDCEFEPDSDIYEKQILLDQKWDEFIEDVVVIVDGVEYKEIPKLRSYDKAGETVEEIEEHWAFHSKFPGIDYDAANNIIIKYGDECYALK